MIKFWSDSKYLHTSIVDPGPGEAVGCSTNTSIVTYSSFSLHTSVCISCPRRFDNIKINRVLLNRGFNI